MGMRIFDSLAAPVFVILENRTHSRAKTLFLVKIALTLAPHAGVVNLTQPSKSYAFSRILSLGRSNAHAFLGVVSKMHVKNHVFLCVFLHAELKKHVFLRVLV